MPNDYLTDEDKKILEEIDKLDDYKQMREGWFPPTVRNVKSNETLKYFFISYSHLDYKRVFKDLFKLIRAAEHISNEENTQIPFFVMYDKELLAGRDWETVVGSLITNSNCKGVIFYISENSLNSNAIHKEIEYVKKSGKPCLSINFPVANLEDQTGKYISAQEFFQLLYSKDRLTNVKDLNEKLIVFESVFNEKVIFLTDIEDDVKRVKYIINSLKGVPVLNFTSRAKKAHPIQSDIKELVVSSINDVNVVEINNSDFNCEYEAEGTDLSASVIGGCAFANCRYLEKIDLPNTIEDIGNNAFYNCQALKAINLDKVITIGESSFAGCTSLREININHSSSLRLIGSGAFYNCSSLNLILEIPDRVGALYSAAFEGSGIKKVIFSKNSKLCILENSVFKNCTQLEEIKFPPCISFDYVDENQQFILGDTLFENCINLKEIALPQGVSKLGNNVFRGCLNLKKLIIPVSLTEIGDNCFAQCKNLTDLFYEGKLTEFNRIKIGKGLIVDFNKWVKDFMMKSAANMIYYLQHNNAPQSLLNRLMEVNLHCSDGLVKIYFDKGVIRRKFG